MPVRVLIVDDHEPFRRAAREVIEATEGFEPAGEAGTGEESVELARTLRPDLVLMDVRLPGMDGIEATHLIRAASDGVNVLLISTYEDDDFGARAAECGALAYLPKSAFGPETLAEVWAAATRG